MSIVTDDAGSHGAPDRRSVSQRLVQLASRYAGEGDVRRAQLASWAADVYVLEELLWDNGLSDAPDPVAQLAAVGESVASALEALADNVSGDVMPRALVDAARRAMVSTFDESVHEVLLAHLPALDHLDACDPAATPPETDARSAARERLGEFTPEELVAELRQVAADCVHVREVMDAEGEATASDRMSHQADVATFEAYLIAAAIRSGDLQLASVDLRWELARELTPADWAEPGTGNTNPFATLRRELIALVGSAEMEPLWRTFEAQEGTR